MTEEVYKNWIELSSLKEEKFIVLIKETNDVDEINNFMDSYWSKIWNYVKLMRKISMKRKNWSDFRVLHSTQLQEDWSKIEVLSLNSQARFRNYRMKLIWMIREIFKMLNQYAVEILTLPVNQGGMLSRSKGMPSRSEMAAKHVGQHTWYTGKRFCRSSCVFYNTLSAGIESMEFRKRRTNSLINGGEEWETNASSGSEMPVRTVSQKFSHPLWGRLFKELWGRPTTTADLRSSFRQIPYTSHVCLLEDKIQDWGMYLLTISYGSNAMDQRSGVGWFSGWFDVFVINKRNSNARFWNTRCEDCFSTEQNHP